MDLLLTWQRQEMKNRPSKPTQPKPAAPEESAGVSLFKSARDLKFCVSTGDWEGVRQVLQVSLALAVRNHFN